MSDYGSSIFFIKIDKSSITAEEKLRIETELNTALSTGNYLAWDNEPFEPDWDQEENTPHKIKVMLSSYAFGEDDDENDQNYHEAMDVEGDTVDSLADFLQQRLGNQFEVYGKFEDE